MSWRETLGVDRSTEAPCPHKSQNPHKTNELLNCADIADSADADSEELTSDALGTLADACLDIHITPAEVHRALSPEDIENWRNGSITDDALVAFARALAQRREMDQGKRPTHYNEHANCKHCGPIWLWFSGDVVGCPWCWNRIADKQIPRPCEVYCGGCVHFERIEHPYLGHCAKGQPEAIAGLVDSDPRQCERFSPRP